MNNFKSKIRQIIFGVDTFGGKLFDVVLLYAIVISVAGVMLESVKGIKADYGHILYFIEWFFTILFTIEYFARIYAVNRSLNYVFSFFGIVDLLSIIPTYLSLFIVGTHSLMVIRVLRLLRIFRIFKLTRYINGSKHLIESLKAGREKIIVFLFSVLMITFIIGTLMYIIETPENGFTSIPRSIYWAIVTITTVGFGDITPQTELGQFFASILMIVGYAIIAVPTGIVSAEMVQQKKEENRNDTHCIICGYGGHQSDAKYCRNCGEQLKN